MEDGEDMETDDLEEQYVPEGGIRIGDIYIPPPPPPACTFESTGPRLIITHIVNDFFKSYAGNQVLGPFHKSFTSIVGPNGSGKSNVIDSMLFVFGYRSQRLRSKKISNMIHNSDTHKDVQSCTVSVHFQEIIDKGEDYEEVPNSKLVVTRTAYKDNSSFYQVNGKRCQFKDVAKLLRAKGIDLDHNRFLILQGEVESISLMKPKALTEHDTGMLEFLEEIIGTSRFKIPIEQLAQKVAELNELRVEKLNRVKLVEKEKNELEGPMKEAVGHLRMENDKTHLANKLSQKELLDLEEAVNSFMEKKASIEASVSDLTDNLKAVQARRKEKEAEINAKGDELKSLNKKIEELSKVFDKHEVEDTTLKEDIKSSNMKRKKVMQQIKLEEEKQEKLKNLPEENREKIAECEEQQAKLEKRVQEEGANYEAAMATLRQETQVFQDEKEKHETKLVDLKKVVDEAQSVLTIASNELNIYTGAEQKERIRLEQLQASIQSTRAEVKEKGARLAELQTTVPERQAELGQKQKSAQAAAQQLEEAKKQLQSLRSEYEEKSAAQNATKTHGKVHDALMQQKKNGNIPGIIGRLGDLGAIDIKYDVAVSTAGGGSLDTILVDTAATGKQCIEFLKQHNIGRGNFLALDKTTRFQAACDHRQAYPLGAPRLFDLIRVSDPAVRTAFYHYLQDTLVATDIEQANKIAFGAVRYRVVTLGGELIEKVGTMTGGGRNKLSGKMGQQVAAAPATNPREMKKMETDIEQLAQQCRDLQAERQQLEDQILRLGKDLKELEKERSKLGVAVNPLQEQLTMLEGQVQAQEARVRETAADKKKVADMEKKVKAAETKYNEASEKAEEVEREVRRCDAKIKEITGGKVKTIQKKLDDSKKQLEKIKKEMTRLKVEISHGERELNKCKEKIENLEAEKKDYEENMLSIKSRREEIEEECKKVMEEKEEAVKGAEEASRAITGLKTELDAVAKEETQLKSNRIEVDRELQNLDENIMENRNRGAMIKRLLKKYKLQEVPGEEVGELKEYSREELKEVDNDVIRMGITALEDKLSSSKPNMAAINEYKKKEEVYMARVAELDAMTAARDEQKKHHDDLRKQRLTDFMEGFGIITSKLKEMYQMITLGGDAELELVDSLDPFSEGIVFSVRPPKKSWKNISNLSGGEKTLSSLALVFALHYYKPTPLYVMDEIDAALDFKNVSIVANYIKERTKNAQFIIISLRSNMFELADRLVGIYKTHNCTKSATVNPACFLTNCALSSQPQKAKDVTAVSGSSVAPLAEMDVDAN